MASIDGRLNGIGTAGQQPLLPRANQAQRRDLLAAGSARWQAETRQFDLVSALTATAAPRFAECQIVSATVRDTAKIILDKGRAMTAELQRETQTVVLEGRARTIGVKASHAENQVRAAFGELIFDHPDAGSWTASDGTA